MGSVNRIEEMRMLTKNDPITNFPERFVTYYSEDDITWHQLHEENFFLSEPGTWYKWRFSPVNLRYLKLVFFQEKQQNKKDYVTEVIELELYSSPDKKDYGGPAREPLPYASVLRSGIIRLAVDGEVKKVLWSRQTIDVYVMPLPNTVESSNWLLMGKKNQVSLSKEMINA